MEEGIVLELLSKMCLVDMAGEILRCAYRGKLFENMGDVKSPVVPGDRVHIARTSEGEGVVEEVLARRNKLSRPASFHRHIEQIMVANVDCIAIVASTRKPPFRPGLIDRILIAAAREELDAVVCLNKIDLIEGKDCSTFLEPFREQGYPVFFTSAVTGEGVDNLKECLLSKVTVLVGHSGAGKSSLLNLMNPSLHLRTGEVSRASGRGKHVTSSARLFPVCNETFVVDTPGVREFGLWDITREELDSFFPSISSQAGACRFNTCTHTHEPACAVKKALEEGAIQEERYKAYLRILESLKKDLRA